MSAARWIPASLTTRRAWLKTAGLGSLIGAAGLSKSMQGQSSTHDLAGRLHGAHDMGPIGRVSTEVFDPSAFLR